VECRKDLKRLEKSGKATSEMLVCEQASALVVLSEQFQALSSRFVVEAVDVSERGVFEGVRRLVGVARD